MNKKRDFYVIVEQDEDGVFIGEVPQLKACYSQGKTLDELLENIKEVIEMCLEEEKLDNYFVSLLRQGLASSICF